MFRFRAELLIFWILIFKLSMLAPAEVNNHWVIWNVGQGQWVTHITTDQCRHYDFGGELGNFNKLRRSLIQFCFGRENQIVLSHWDFDHFSHIPALIKTLPEVCWLSQPEGGTDKLSVQNVLRLNIKPCLDQNLLVPQNHTEMWRPKDFRSSNDSSGVYQEEAFLLPGDSSLKEEKKWSRQMKNLEQVKVLVLGHHGSRTSTGNELLHGLTNLKVAIASARFAKYHHPHSITLGRLREHQIPVLRTEDWGNIHF